MNTIRHLAALTVLAAATAWAPAVLAQGARAATVTGEKLDNGLGDLPPYAQWEDKTGHRPMGGRVLGESLDDGLGELPHYSQWLDPTGRDPLGKGLNGRKLATR